MSITAPSEASLEGALRDILANDVTSGSDSHVIDGTAPSWIATPASEERLAKTLAKANELGATVVPWGAGLQMGIGGELQRYDVALDTSRLSSLIDYEPADLTATVGAGMTLGQLQHTLDAHGQFLPLDGPAHATLGGLLSVAHGGPTQHAYGPPRDWVLGCKIALANGDVVRAGGRVVKNVAGYDLTRMALGSLGTLGVMTELTLKIAPQPAVQQTLLFACQSAESSLETASTISGRGLALRAIIAVENQLACWLAGSESAVARSHTEIQDIAGDIEAKALDGEAADRWWASLDLLDATSDVTVRVSVPSASSALAMQRVAAGASASGASVKRVVLPTVGIVTARFKDSDPSTYASIITTVQAHTERLGGSVIVTRAPADVKRQVDVWGAVQGLDLMRSLKREFDPNSTLNPGRFVGGI